MQWVDEPDTGYFTGERRDPTMRALDRTEKLGKQIDELAGRTWKLGQWCADLVKQLQDLTALMIQMNERIEALEKTKPGEWEQPPFEKVNNE